MNPKPKGVSGSHFVGLDIFRRTLTVVDEQNQLTGDIFVSFIPFK